MKRFFKKNPKSKSSPDYFFIIIVGLLIIFGLVMLASASSDIAKEQFGDSYYYLKHQILYGLLFGILGFFLTSSIYYQRFEKIALILLIINIIALILIFTPLGIDIKGSNRWLQIGNFSFQPGELLKFTFIIYLASWMSKNKLRNKSFTEGMLPLIVIMGAIGFLLVIQPATTIAVIILLASTIVYFSSGAKFKFIAGIMLIGVICLSFLIYLTPYRMNRIKTFMNPKIDTLGNAYHINQSLIAIGSGKITGVGYGQSTTKFKYLPEPIGDSIFAVIGEELGFVGSIGVLLTFLILTQRGFAIAKKSSNSFGYLLVIGFTSVIAIQAIINIGAVSNFIPLTGVTLPFISYGGTSLASFMLISGMIVNISKYSK